MSGSGLGLLGFGFVLGLRHALDVDHLAAVSTMVSNRRHVWSASLVGAAWGAGHTAAILAAAMIVIGLHAEIPPVVTTAFELGVAAMLIVLGGRLLLTLHHGGRLHLHPHAHGGRTHLHPHVHPPGDLASHRHVLRSGRRPLLVGLVHGLAGSAALMLAVVATIPSTSLALAYVAVFGLGSVAGMVVMSALLGVPLALASARFVHAELALRGGAAVTSIVVGLTLAWQVATTVG